MFFIYVLFIWKIGFVSKVHPFDTTKSEIVNVSHFCKEICILFANAQFMRYLRVVQLLTNLKLSEWHQERSVRRREWCHSTFFTSTALIIIYIWVVWLTYVNDWYDFLTNFHHLSINERNLRGQYHQKTHI